MKKYTFEATIGGKKYYPKGFYYQGKHIILVGCEVEGHSTHRKELITDVEIVTKWAGLAL